MLIASICILSACATQPQSSGVHWESTFFQEHQLTGKIWRSRDGEFIEQADLLAAVAQAQFLLLGEKHDNPDHHALRSRLLTQLLENTSVAQVSLEMLDSSQQLMLEKVQTTGALADDELRLALAWDEAGWNWEFYGPLIQQLLSVPVQLASANISRADVTAVYQGDIDERAVAVLEATKVAQLEKDIDASHCGMLPASQFASMVRVQQARDLQMADSLLRNYAEDSGVRILIAGNYHIRRDVGVPAYLLAAGRTDSSAGNLSASDIVTLAFLEVSPTLEEPHYYAEQQYAAGAFDFIWFTPAFTQEDYCASLRGSL